MSLNSLGTLRQMIDSGEVTQLEFLEAYLGKIPPGIDDLESLAREIYSKVTTDELADFCLRNLKRG